MPRTKHCFRHLFLASVAAIAAQAVSFSTARESGEPTPVAAPAADASGHTWSKSHFDQWLSCYVVLPPGYECSEVRMNAGDDPRWATPDWDDHTWRDVTYTGVPTRAGIFWTRLRLRGASEMPGTAYVKVAAAYDLYWDGRHVSRSGLPANTRVEERAGPLESYLNIPEEWRGPGEHVVAFRMSTHRAGFPTATTDVQFWLGTRDPSADLRGSVIPAALAEGALIMIALISLIMWLIAARRTSLLLLVGLCLCAAATQALTVQRYGFTYPYDWHYPARLAAAGASLALSACLVAFVGLHFSVPAWKRIMALFVALSAGVLWIAPALGWYYPLRERSGLVVLFGFLCALLGTIRAYRLHRIGAGMAVSGTLIGTVVVWALRGRVIEGPGFFLAFLPVLFGLAAAVAVGLRAEREKAHAAQLTTARLEVELLKKNLQPHFLLNTLTALTEVIEQSPATAVKLIDDLSTEFRTLSRMSGERLVPLEEEIELCRAHLRVMSVRTATTLRLDAELDDLDAPVPPAMFLTLIENGLVHQKHPTDEAAFTLRAETTGSRVQYTFHSAGDLKPSSKPGGGTGLRYVRARLEESYPGAWSLRHGPAYHGWTTTIEVPRAPALRVRAALGAPTLSG